MFAVCGQRETDTNLQDVYVFTVSFFSYHTVRSCMSHGIFPFCVHEEPPLQLQFRRSTGPGCEQLFSVFPFCVCRVYSRDPTIPLFNHRGGGLLGLAA